MTEASTAVKLNTEQQPQSHVEEIKPINLKQGKKPFSLGASCNGIKRRAKEMSPKAKIGIALSVIAALVIGGGLFAIHKTVGFPAAGEAMKNFFGHTVPHWLNQAHPHDVKNWEIVAGVGAGALLLGGGYAAGRYHQRKIDERDADEQF